MDVQTIVVEIAKDGTATVDVDGVKDKTCLDITKKLEKNLGVVGDRKMKSTAGQATATKRQQRNQT